MKSGDDSKSVCVSQPICDLKVNSNADVRGDKYTIIADNECMALAKPVIPSLTYKESPTLGEFGSTCQKARDCTSTEQDHGCLNVSNEKEKIRVCVDNCSIGAGSKVTVGTKEWKVIAKTCLKPIPPENTKDNLGRVKEEGLCKTSE